MTKSQSIKVKLMRRAYKTRAGFVYGAHGVTFEFSLSAHILQMLLASKINSHISSKFCPDHQDGRWIIKALIAI